MHSVSTQPEPSLNSTLEEISVSNQDKKPPSTFAGMLETDCAIKVPKILATNSLEDCAITDYAKNSAVFGDSASSLRGVTESPTKETITNMKTTVNTSIELENPIKSEQSSVIDSSDLHNSTDKEYREVNRDEKAFQVPDNPCSNEPDEISPLKVERISFGMSDKPLERYSDPDFAFNVPKVPSNNPCDPDIAFKMPENPLTNEGDEQFVDAVQFFRDPNSIKFLESIRTSVIHPGSSPINRSSLYINFDPLHSKFRTNVSKSDNCELISATVQENDASVENSEHCSPEVVNKNLVNVAVRESLGNTLISFDSSKPSMSKDSIPAPTPSPPKLLTEEDFQQQLKIHELKTQEVCIKKQRELEMQIARRDELLRSQRIVIEEMCEISVNFSKEFINSEEKIMSLEAENKKLKEDLNTLAEDLLSVENTFTDFNKRYEQCKGMLKTFKDNEELLKRIILDLQTDAKEHKMYHLLQERTEDMLEKANIEVDNMKRSSESQVTVLKAQLKKAEMKISSLESDIKQIKIENSQLDGICDDLMAKVDKS